MNLTENENIRTARYRDVDTETAGQRLDNFLLSRLKGVPRSHVYRLIRSGQVRVNSGRVAPRYRLRAGDRVRIPPVRQGSGSKPRPDASLLDRLAGRIVHEDSRVLVIDKPAGLAVHGGSGVDLGCIEALRSLRPGLRTLELVHRLDRATSGCLLVAKRRSSLRALHQLLREGRVEKRYLALVRGNWQFGSIEIDEPLRSDRRSGETRTRVAAEGKPAQSQFRPIEQFGNVAAFMEVRIGTGRTHQIRAHAAHLEHPIAGDERYGDERFNKRMNDLGLDRMFLHAHAVAFRWPDSDEEFSVSVPLPLELGRVLESLEHKRGKRKLRSTARR